MFDNIDVYNYKTEKTLDTPDGFYIDLGKYAYKIEFMPLHRWEFNFSYRSNSYGDFFIETPWIQFTFRNWSSLYA